VGATTAVFTIKSYRFQRCFLSEPTVKMIFGGDIYILSPPVLIIPSGENSVSKNNLWSSD